MVTSPQTSPVRVGDVFKRIDMDYSTRQETVLAGSGGVRSLVVGEVVGARTKGTVATSVPLDGETPTNTGDGSIGTPTLGALAIPGRYIAVCIAEASNSGTFRILDPTGRPLANATVAVAYASDHLNFTITDGANDWDIGDEIYIDVSGDGKIVALAPAAVNGTQEAHGLMYADIEAADGVDNPNGVVVVGPAIVAESKVTWPSGISAGAKAAAIAALEAKGIIIRTDL